MKRIVAGSNTVVDYWNHGDGTVSVVFIDEQNENIELVFSSSSVLSRLSKAADRARDYLKLVKRPPMIYDHRQM